MDILADSTSIALIDAPVETIDLTTWLFTLKDNEYQACSPDHLAAGSSLSGDGKRKSLNVEVIAGNLLVQHYLEDISLRDHCRVNSISDSISPAGRTTLGITWELTIRKISDRQSELSNRVIVSLTGDFLDLLQKANITDLEPIKLNMSQNAATHNQGETPLFAKDIERKALDGTWNQ